MQFGKMPTAVEISPRKQGQPRVLVVRLSGGRLPAKQCRWRARCANGWPESHITWVVEKGAAPLVAANDAVDGLIVLPKGFANSLGTLRRVRRKLAHERFDFTLDPQGLTKSGLVAWLSGAAADRICPAGSAEINPWLQTELVVSRKMHRVERYLELLRPLERRASECSVRSGYSARCGGDGRWLVSTERSCAAAMAINPGAGWTPSGGRLSGCGSGTVFIKPWNCEPRDIGRKTGAGLGGNDRGPVAGRGNALPADIAPGTCRRPSAGACCRFRYGPAAPGSGGHALRGALWSIGGKRLRALWERHLCLQQALDESPRRKGAGADNWAMRRIEVEMVCGICEGAALALGL